MNALDLIIEKRDGGAHSDQRIEELVRGVTDGSIPDYQLAAWLMAVLWRGLDEAETRALTDAMVRSGETVDLSRLRDPAIDKHSTGGVGDKTSLVVGPLAAATGLTVAKMSGRGLGHTGGTLDKLESIPGLSVDLDSKRFMEQAEQVGLVIAGQTAELAPADKRLYALRDVTGTVPSLPLIAASIMSKKLAAGAEGIVLDVKVGSGAFMRELDEARQLAHLMMDLGQAAGRRMAACISRMDQPLGRAIGNALEVAEAVATLRGEGPNDLHQLCLAIAGQMHVVAGHARKASELDAELIRAIQSGRALAVLRNMVEAQGGDPRCIDEPQRLPRAPVVQLVHSREAGWVTGLDALAAGRIAAELGAGRQRKDAVIDPAVGIRLRAKPGDRIEAGVELAEIHARGQADADRAAAALLEAFQVDPECDPGSQAPILIETLDAFSENGP